MIFIVPKNIFKDLILDKTQKSSGKSAPLKCLLC